jgi:hypothetical protein
MGIFDSLMAGETGGMPDGVLNQTGWRGAMEGNNPMLNIGLGILANNSGNYGSTFAALGKGAQQGVKDTQASRQAQQQAALYKLKMAQAQKELLEQKKKEDWLKNYGQPNATQESTTQAPDTWQNAMQGQTQPNFNMERVAGKQTTTQTPIFDQNKALLSGIQNGAIDFKDYLSMTAQAKPKYSQTPQYDQEGNAFVLDDSGNVKRLDGIKEKKELMVTPGGLAINKNDSSNIGKTFNADDNNPNKPFILVNGQIVPNKAYQDYEINKASAGASRTNISVSTDKKYGEIFGAKIAEQDAAAIDAAKSSHDRIDSSRRVKQLLAQNPITGTGAGARLALEKAFVTAGIIDGTNVANTEALASNLASQTLDAIKTSGLGSGQGFTDKDRIFLQEAKSGRIEMNGMTLNRLADLNERAALKSIEKGNSVIRSLKGNKDMGDVVNRLEEIQIPSIPVSPKTVSPIKIKNDADFNKLPSGATFIDPFGKKRIKP